MPEGRKNIFARQSPGLASLQHSFFPMLPKPWSGKEPSRPSLISLKMLILTLPLHIHEPVVSFRCRGQ